MKPLVFAVKDPVFKVEPLFVIGCGPQELHDYILRRFRIDQEVGEHNAGTMFTFSREPWRLVWVRHPPRDPECLPVLLHEVFHLVTRICGDKGIPIVHHISNGDCGDEAAAYMYEHFARKVLAKLARKKRTPK